MAVTKKVDKKKSEAVKKGWATRRKNEKKFIKEYSKKYKGAKRDGKISKTEQRVLTAMKKRLQSMGKQISEMK